ncbi:MAG: hypothetical protein ACSHXF_00045 [Aquaticitalea sp.]
MKFSTIIAILCLTFFATSCNVTESIVFNEQMGGTYKTSFDLSAMMAMANEGRPASVEREVKEPVDTTIVFSQFLETYKDSIATLPADKQAQMADMKGVIMDMQMDEAKGIFNFSMEKSFVNFDELKTINDQIDGAMTIAESFGKKDTGANTSQDQLDELTKTDPVNYTFANQTFTRTKIKKDEGDQLEEGDEQEGNVEMSDMFKSQFEEMFKSTFYTMTYTFPKPIKTTSNKDAVVSDDRKTITVKNNLNAIDNDATLMDLEVILED